MNMFVGLSLGWGIHEGRHSPASSIACPQYFAIRILSDTTLGNLTS